MKYPGVFVLISLLIMSGGAYGQTKSIPVKDIDWSLDGKYIAAGQRGITIYDSRLNRIAYLDVIFNGSLSWSPDGNYLAFFHTVFDSQVGWERNLMEIWNMSTASYVISSFEVAFPGYLAWHPDSSKVAVSGFAVEKLANGSEIVVPELIHIIDVTTGTSIDRVEIPEFIQITSLSWSPDGRYLAASEVEDFIILYNVNDLRSPLEKLIVSPNSDLLLWGDDSKHILISSLAGVEMWNIETGQVEVTYDVSGRVVSSFDWQTDIVAGNPFDENSQFVRVWRVSTGEIIKEIEATDIVLSLALSPDGTKLVYGDGAELKIISLEE